MLTLINEPFNEVGLTAAEKGSEREGHGDQRERERGMKRRRRESDKEETKICESTTVHKCSAAEKSTSCYVLNQQGELVLQHWSLCFSQHHLTHSSAAHTDLRSGHVCESCWHSSPSLTLIEGVSRLSVLPVALLMEHGVNYCIMVYSHCCRLVDATGASEHGLPDSQTVFTPRLLGC